MAHFPLQSLRGLRPDPPDKARPNGTLADTDGELDWDKVTRLAWRPAWAIRSRRGALAAFLDMFRKDAGADSPQSGAHQGPQIGLGPGADVADDLASCDTAHGAAPQQIVPLGQTIEKP